MKKKQGRFLIPDLNQVSPMQCVQFQIPDDIMYRVALMGALNSLGSWISWERTGDNQGAQIAQIWRNLLADIQFGDCGIDGESCVAIPPRHPAIQYEPQNIFKNEPSPAGYFGNAFYQLDTTIDNLNDVLDALFNTAVATLTGLQDGDLLVPPTAIPVIGSINILDIDALISSLTQGFPRFTLNFSGTGTIKLHLLTIPLGGVVLVSKNIIDVGAVFSSALSGSLLNDIQILEVNRDLAQVPPETMVELIHEVDFPEDGNHTLHVVWCPRIDDAITPLGYGGGLRKIEICGGITLGEQQGLEMAQLRPNENDPCILEYSNDFGRTWATLIDLNQCAGKLEFRQNPDDDCQLQQSSDGGENWTLAFDYSLCQQPTQPITEPLKPDYELLNQILDLLEQLKLDYDGSVGSIAPDLVYDATSDDDFRDLALCHACHEIIDIMCDAELEARSVLDGIATAIEIGATIAGFFVATTTIGVGVPFAMALISSGLSYISNVSDVVLENKTARSKVACCMYDSIKGATLTKTAFQASLSSCGFSTNSPESQLAGAISGWLSEDDTYISFLDFVQRFYRYAELGIAECGCDDTWCLNFFGGNGNIANEAYIFPIRNFTLTEYIGTELVAGQPPYKHYGLLGRLRFNIDPANPITSISGNMDYRTTRIRVGNEFDVLLRGDNGTIQALGGNASGAGSFNFDFQNIDTSGLTFLEIRFGVSQNTVNDSAYARITNLQVNGSGSTPNYGGTSC